MRNVSVKGLRGPPSSSASPYSSCEAAFAGLRVILFSNGGSYLIGVRRGISNIQMKHRQIHISSLDGHGNGHVLQGEAGDSAPRGGVLPWHLLDKLRVHVL